MKRRSRAFELTTETLRAHRAGAPLLLAAKAVGRSFSFFEEAAPIRPEAAAGGAVAIVGVFGPLSQRAELFLCGYSDGYDAITARFGAAMEDPEVGSVLLLIDSPGGDAAGNLEAVRRMREMRDRAGKTVFAFADELAASAAYAVATLANGGIYLPKSGEVGSVGALVVHAEESKALAEEGITVTVLRSGAKKAEANGLEPLAEGARGRLQGIVDALAGQFADVVAEARSMTRAQVLSLDGAIFMGEDAVTAGLADGVASMEDVMSMAASAAEKRSARMKLAKVFGLEETATTEQIQAAAEAHMENAELGALVRAMAERESDARVEVTRWHDSHTALEALRAEREAEQKAAELKERVALVAKLVETGWELPGTAWQDPVSATDPAKRAPAEPYASMPIQALRDRAAKLSAMPRLAQAKTPAGLTEPTLEDAKLAEQIGVAPRSVAEARLEMNLARLNAAGDVR